MWLILVGTVFGNAALFLAEVFEDAFLLLGMAERGLAPKIFRRRTARTQAPAWSFLAATVVILAVINLNFNSILNVTNILNCVSLTMILVAALLLRWRQPDKRRPFQVPCGMPGLVVAVVVPSCAVIFMVGILMATQTWVENGMALGLVAIGPLGRGTFLLVQRCRKRRRGEEGGGGAEEEDGLNQNLLTVVDTG